MGSFRDDESMYSMQSMQSDSTTLSIAPGEKIFVVVRLRPLNDRETARNEASEWECINNSTIIHKHGLPEKSVLPNAYTFDKVFAPECPTKQVFEEGLKNVALSVVTGINTSIFAYGQTSSGKTYTMRGISEYAMASIFDYICEHNEREFVLKFSAMEIYNESVRDLLGLDSTPLKLLDDPERGIVVDKLTEVTLRDWSHLKELLAVCEAERQIGETSLNATSSRSHQIIRLTVQSYAREFASTDNLGTLTASVSFVDLAGSERSSQTSTTGSRLKEGSHINRSLLTLGTVIRKLSKGKNMHVPYRDSKLTRILQNSLGGNARTAIICTMSPSHSHAEQSRNTLLFATSAKQVSTNAQVNVVMSEKALVKHLQKELARLENELRNVASISTPGDPASLLREKELLIEKMDTEIRDLTHQRDLAQSHLQEMLQSTSDHQVSKTWIEADHIPDTSEKRSSHYQNSISDSSEVVDPPPHTSDRSHSHNSVNNVPQLPDNSEDFFLPYGSPSEYMNKYFGPDLSRGWEEISQKNYDISEESCKEVRCVEVELDKSKNSETAVVPLPHNGDGDIGHVHFDPTYEAPQPKSQDKQMTTDNGFVGSKPTESTSSSSDTETSSSGNIKLAKSSSCRERDMTVSSIPSSQKYEKDAKPLNEYEVDFAIKPEETMLDISHGKLRTGDSSYESDSLDEKEQHTKMIPNFDTGSLLNGVRENKEALKHNYKVKYGENTVQDAETNKYELMKIVNGNNGSRKCYTPENQSSDWKLEFERQRKHIIQLWDACYIPLVHRSYFFLLFQGDPSDSVYMEVEYRRLSFLMQTTSRGTSSRAIERERDMLIKQISKKYRTKQREILYKKWGIELNSKQRRKQLSRKLWKDTEDINHIKASATLVAKLVGELSQASKETFGLSFAPQHGSFTIPSTRKSICAP